MRHPLLNSFWQKTLFSSVNWRAHDAQSHDLYQGKKATTQQLVSLSKFAETVYLLSVHFAIEYRKATLLQKPIRTKEETPKSQWELKVKKASY